MENKKITVNFFKYLYCLLLVCTTSALAGTTGKLAGRVTDKDNGEPLVGVNIIVEGTPSGAASDINGYYSVLNIQPGNYNVLFSMMGYSKILYEDIRIRVDQTTTLNSILSPTIIDLGETITVVGRRALVQRDLTATVSIVSSSDIENMPVEEFSEVLEIQSGVV